MMSDSEKQITVYLIRHGESTSNVQFKVLVDSIIGFLCVRGFSLDNMGKFLSSLGNLFFDYEPDSDLSELGMQQVTLNVL
jgi:hypothetical protein